MRIVADLPPSKEVPRVPYTPHGLPFTYAAEAGSGINCLEAVAS